MRIEPKSFRPIKPHGFIVLDGVNGAGKSTLQKRLRDYLTAAGVSVCCTREPGSTELGKKIRALILDEKSPPPPVAELLLFGADRAEHVVHLISPELEKGVFVLSDRYYYSTIAFQGFGRGIDRALIDEINRIAVQGVLPDLVILLDLEPQEGLKRIRQRKATSAGSETDRLEFEQADFHKRVREGFLALVDELSEPFVVIDAAMDAEEVFARAIEAIEPIVRALPLRGVK